jgi:hypothetical protein
MQIYVFDETRLERLFRETRMIERSFVGRTSVGTNSIAAWLMERSGNSWGTYTQDEICVNCDSEIIAPQRTGLRQKIMVASAHHLNRAQVFLSRPRPIWIHAVFSKDCTLST